MLSDQFSSTTNLQIQCDRYQNSKYVFCRNEKSILKFTWHLKGPWIAKTFLKKNKTGRFTFPDLKTHHKDTVIKTNKKKKWYHYKDKHIDQLKRKLRNNPSHLWSDIFWQRCKDIQWVKGYLFINGTGETENPHVKEWSWTLTWHHIQKFILKNQRSNFKT